MWNWASFGGYRTETKNQSKDRKLCNNRLGVKTLAPFYITCPDKKMNDAVVRAFIEQMHLCFSGWGIKELASGRRDWIRSLQDWCFRKSDCTSDNWGGQRGSAPLFFNQYYSDDPGLACGRPSKAKYFPGGPCTILSEWEVPTRTLIQEM
jgi:hypothetical protein